MILRLWKITNAFKIIKDMLNYATRDLMLGIALRFFENLLKRLNK